LFGTDYEKLRTCKRVGLFDSGVGGLTVLHELAKLKTVHLASGSGKGNGGYLPRQFIYLGDTARCPYGDRSPKEIVSFVTEIVAWFMNVGVDGIVVACNTSASVALESVRELSTVPVFDLITPTAGYVAKLGRKVAVMATAATAKSRAFSKAIYRLAPDLEVLDIPCPDLVPIVESGRISHAETIATLANYANVLMREKAEVLVWGCTHFPFLAEPLAKLIATEILMVDPAKVLLGILEPKADQRVGEEDGRVDCAIYVTGDPANFTRTASVCLGYVPGTVHGITIDELVGLRIAEKNSVKEKRSAGEGSSAISACK